MPTNVMDDLRIVPRASFVAIALFAALTTLVFACKDKGKDAGEAAAQLSTLTALADRDVGEVERGMPEGGKKLAALWANGQDPAKDLPAVRKALQNTRRQVQDLNVAKSTFFALTDANGVAIRNDLEEDVMAGQNLATIFPELKNAATKGFVTTTGAFPNASTKNGPDKDWIAAVPVKKDDGSVGGFFVSGWTYRYFARHLSENLKSQLTEKAQKSGDNKLPVFYVAVFDKSGVYSAPLTPQVNEKALSDLDLVAKTANGNAQGTVDITNRDFGWAAARVAKLGPETGIALLYSNL
jgi:hypothetical protein